MTTEQKHTNGPSSDTVRAILKEWLDKGLTGEELREVANDFLEMYDEEKIQKWRDVRWDLFPSYLLDHCEGDILTEEGLQRSLSRFLDRQDVYVNQISATAKERDTLAAKVKELEAQIGDLQECEKCGERLPEESFSVGAVMDGWGDDPCCDACYYKHELSVVSAQRDELLTMMSRFSKYPSKTLDELSAESMRKISAELVAKIEAEKTTKE